jgi:hypothetical protein
LAAKVKYFDADKYPEARKWVLEPVVG